MLIFGSIGIASSIVAKSKTKLPIRTSTGIEVFYVSQEDDILCPKCANKLPRNQINQALINWSSDLVCSSCFKQIKSVYVSNPPTSLVYNSK